MKGVGHANASRGHPGVPRSMSLYAHYHKEQEYIWFMGGDLNGFSRFYAFNEMKGVGHAPRDPPTPPGSQDPCHLMRLIIRIKNIYGLGVVF